MKNLFEKQILQYKENSERKNYEKDHNDVPIIQPPVNIEGFKIQKDSDEFISILDEKLKQLRLSVIDKDNSLSESDEPVNLKDVDQLAAMFANQDINETVNINPVYAPRALDKHYYKRLSPQDLLFEETETFQNSYSGKSIYEWNIDGLNDKQIIDIIHRMIMYSTVCKQQGNSDSSIASFITTGFVGQLRGWWDHYLSDAQKKEILSHKKIIKIEESSSSMLATTAMTGEEDAVYTLCLSILQHFVGTNIPIAEKLNTLLQNLRCPSLTHFRWYKDTFLSRVFQLTNPNSVHWKSKFIDGLPHLFSEKVRQSLRNKNDGVNINYSDLTYGQIISACVNEGLSLCNDIKLKNQLKKQRLTEKHQLGEFCEQFAFDLGSPPSKERKRVKLGKEYRKEYRNPRKNKGYTKPFRKKGYKYKKEIDNKPYKSYPKRKRKAKKLGITCHKCGKVGHYANECLTKKALNNIEDEDLRNHLQKVLLLNSDHASEESDYMSEISEESDYMTKENEELSTGDSDSDNKNCQCNELNYWKSIVNMNGLIVLTSEQDQALKVLESISDNNLKRKMIEFLIKENSREKSPMINEAPYQLSEVLSRFQQVNIKETPVSIIDLKREVNQLKSEIIQIKNNNDILNHKVSILENNNILINNSDLIKNPSYHSEGYLNIIQRVTSQKWFTKITLIVNKVFVLKDEIALIDSGADLNCIQEGIIPTKYFVKTTQSLTQAGGNKLQVNFKLDNTYICKDNICLSTPFILVKDLTHRIILGTPFLHMIMPIIKIDQKGITTILKNQKITFDFISDPQTRMLNEVRDLLLKKKEKQICFLKEEINIFNVKNQLDDEKIKIQIRKLESQFQTEVCNDLPNAFWNRKQHVVSLPYEDDFKESQIPTKARPAQMNQEYLGLCKNEIESLLNKKLIRTSKSPWSCTAFYVNKAAEKERGVPRLVINYKPLNKVLKWIRYPIPNKKDLLDRLNDSLIFSKFDMKSGYWQIQINETDRYKTAFAVPFGHYEWNVLPFGLKNAPSEFQNIMNDIFNPYSDFIIVYIDDVLVFSKSLDQHFKHLKIFKNIIIHNGLVLSAPKMKLFQTKVRFLGHEINQGTIVPISRSIEFASKFPDVITDKTQLQNFLGSLNYISDYYKNLAEDTAILYNRLKNKPGPWTENHTQAVKSIKAKVNCLPCLSLANPKYFKIVETDASNLGYGGILKQVIPETSKEVLVRFTSGKWNDTQKKYSTIKKEMLSIIKCISKFQSDLLNQKFLLRIDCRSAKSIIEKDVKNLVAKQIFAGWQAQLSAFDFDIQYIKGENNSLADYLTREFLQGD
ncbi:hypothetical protein QL285_035270 [Trifolium repens]|nr:hypothetical protein QL285_035270 [Trifolium repens]